MSRSGSTVSTVGATYQHSGQLGHISMRTWYELIASKRAHDRRSVGQRNVERRCWREQAREECHRRRDDSDTLTRGICTHQKLVEIGDREVQAIDGRRR